eukprot:CAMPEP_0206147118 /NCGR_PEP_ID=MMETSP1473-20131121/32477_1 /ASSEMBLY_ACC=CAM_ASM_001109 /TAXON_ID=1461547 /ORGANISM="Stichococcus sp, Strain RCC1054" /LENGTH=85 /DNA_ID=CAMNT_0053543933 /DNA_START=380 /DNA_END=637 /DNA_ORIENTATION=+
MRLVGTQGTSTVCSGSPSSSSARSPSVRGPLHSSWKKNSSGKGAGQPPAASTAVRAAEAARPNHPSSSPLSDTLPSMSAGALSVT